MDKRINDFFQDGKVDLVKNEQSSLFNLNGVPNYFTSTWSSDGGPLVHDTYETYRIIFNGRFRNEVIQSICLLNFHPSVSRSKHLHLMLSIRHVPSTPVSESVFQDQSLNIQQ